MRSPTVSSSSAVVVLECHGNGMAYGSPFLPSVLLPFHPLSYIPSFRGFPFARSDRVTQPAPTTQQLRYKDAFWYNFFVSPLLRYECRVRVFVQDCPLIVRARTLYWCCALVLVKSSRHRYSIGLSGSSPEPKGNFW